MDDFKGHGYRISDNLSEERILLGIGIIPGRKNPCLYCETEDGIIPLATFKSIELAQKALRLLDKIARGSYQP